MKDTNVYKEKLESELETLTEELGTLGVINPKNGSDWVPVPEPDHGEADPNTVADSAEDWEEKEAILAELETRINNVHRALKKIEDGKYGVCEISGEQIEEARLDANPSARTCIAHMEEESELE